MVTQLQVPVCETVKVESSRHVALDLQVRDVEGEEVLLPHEFIVGDVTTGLVSLGQLYQAGWKIDGEGSNELFLIDPQDQIKVPVYFKNKSLQSEHVCVMLKNEKMMVTQMFLPFMCALWFKCLRKWSFVTLTRGR